MPVEDFIITVFCLVSEIFDQKFKDVKLRTRGLKPKVTDAEIMTMEVVLSLIHI